MDNKFKPETLCVQAGWQPKKGEPRVLPIYQSTTFKYETSEQMAKLFDLEKRLFLYPPSKPDKRGCSRQDRGVGRWRGRHADLIRTGR